MMIIQLEFGDVEHTELNTRLGFVTMNRKCFMYRL